MQILNVDEIFEMAEQIERNGASFYKRAASATQEEHLRKLFLDLSKMECEHEQTFARMRKEQTAVPPSYDPDGEAARYLQQFANGHVFDVSADSSANISGLGLAETLTYAIGLEKDSIAFYVGLEELVRKDAEKDEIQKIIREEMSHITYLSGELAGSNR